MKDIVAVLFLVFLSGCATCRLTVHEFESDKIIHHSKVGQIENLRAFNEYAIYFDNGDAFPLDLDIDTNFIKAADDSIDLVFKKKIYLRMKVSEDISDDTLTDLENLDKQGITKISDKQRAELLKNITIFISTDAKNWAPIYNMKGVKKVLGFKKGSFSLGLGITKTDGPWAFFKLATTD